MAAIQGLVRTMPASTLVDRMKLRHALRMLKDLRRYRCRMIMQILQERDMHQTELEREMYHRGDTVISQSEVCQTMRLLRKYRVISFRGYDGKYHVYGLNHDRIYQINNALERFHRSDRTL